MVGQFLCLLFITESLALNKLDLSEHLLIEGVTRMAWLCPGKVATSSETDFPRNSTSIKSKSTPLTFYQYFIKNDGFVSFKVHIFCIH